MTKLSFLLNKLMLNREIDDAQLAIATDVAKANVTRLRTDPKANPTLATLKPIAHFFNLTVSQLLGESPLPQQHQVVDVSRGIPLLASDTVSKLKDRTFVAPPQWVNSDQLLSQDAFAIRVQDTTLIPLFRVHAIVIMDLLPTYQDGMYLLIAQKGHKSPFLRQYLVDGKQRLLKSLKLEANWAEPFSDKHEIIGAVMEVHYSLA